MSATFSSFISCYSLCIKLGFQSDAVHRLENYPKISLQQSVVPQSQLSSNLARDVKPRNWRAGGGGRGGENKKMARHQTEVVVLGEGRVEEVIKMRA